MNRQLLLSPLRVMLLLSLALLAGVAWGQSCTPNSAYAGQAAGIYPLPDQSGPIDTFVCAEQGGEAVFTMVVPDSLTVSTARIDLTSLRITGISGLPSNISFSNDVTYYSPNPRIPSESSIDATYPDRSVGCFRVYIPTGTAIGDYAITITATINGFIPLSFGSGSLVPGRHIIRVTSAGGCGTTRTCSELFISEYLEGYGNNKAIEVYNPTANPINLSNYALVRYHNGGSIPFANTSLPSWVVLSGTIPAFSTHVAVLDRRDPNGTGSLMPVSQGLLNVGNSVGNAFYCLDYNTSNALYFNGDDAVALVKNINTSTGLGNFIDIVGKIGVQPTNSNGTFSPTGGWTAESNFVDGIGGFWTTNNTMKRKMSIQTGWPFGIASAPNNAFNPSIEWDTLGVDNFSNLGTHFCSCATGITPINPLICRGSSTTLTASGGTSYRWSTGATSSSITVSPSTTTIYVVTFTNANGLTNIASTTVSVSLPPNLSVTPSSGNICSNSSITLNASNASFYIWSNGATTSSLSLSSLPTGANTFTVTGTNASGCTSTASVSVNVLNGPTVTIGNVAALSCANPSVTITASGASSYVWAGGPSTASRTVSAPGTYTVVGTGSNGCTASASLAITSNIAIPSAVITPSANTLNCTLTSVSLTASGGITYRWDNNTSSASRSVSAAGIYRVTVTAANGCSATATSSITSNTLPPNILVSGPTLVCIGSQFNLSATGADTYLWSSGLGSSVSPYTAPQVAGGRIATVLGTSNVNGCTTNVGFTFNVIDVPQVSVTSSASIGCIGTAVILTANGGTDYRWSNGTATSQNIVWPISNANYIVTVSNAAGLGCSSTASYTLNVASPPIVTLQSVPSVLCGSQSATITANGNASGFVWGNGSSGNSISTSAPGTYTVTGSNSAGCTTTAGLSLGTYPNCGGYLSIEADPICNYFDTLTVRVFVRSGVDVFSAYANLNFDNSILRLVGNSPGNYLGSSIINTPPVVNGGQIDFGMTKTAGQQGSNGDGELYSFRFVLDRLPTNVPYDPTNPNSVSTLFQLSNITCYNRTGNQPPSFSAISNVNASTALRYLIPLWPGDLNNDKRVNVADLLLIGTNYGQSGPPRPTTGLQWAAQPAPLWGFDLTRPNGSAYRCFVDGNGDGLINLSDQASIGFNLGRTHQLVAPNGGTTVAAEPRNEYKSATAAINVELPDSVIQLQQLPMTKVVTVTLGSAQTPLNGVYGVAFDLEFDADFVNTAGITTNYTGSIFGVSNTDFIKIEDPTDITNGRLSIGMTRYNTTAVTATGGRLLTISVPFTANPTRPWFKIRTTPIACNDLAGNNLTVASGIDSMRVNGVVGIGSTDVENKSLDIYPNPTSGFFIVEIPESAFSEDGTTISIFNSLGQLVRSQAITAPKSELNMAECAPGVYLVRLKSEHADLVKTIIKH